MADAYVERAEELARFYAERMSAGFGPALERKLGWIIRDAETAGDRRRARFWQQVQNIARPQEGVA